MKWEDLGSDTKYDIQTRLSAVPIWGLVPVTGNWFQELFWSVFPGLRPLVSGVVGYKPGEWGPSYIIDATSGTIEGLAPNQSYDVRVKPTNGA